MVLLDPCDEQKVNLFSDAPFFRKLPLHHLTIPLVIFCVVCDLGDSTNNNEKLEHQRKIIGANHALIIKEFDV